MSSEKSNNKKVIAIIIAVAAFLLLVLGGYFLASSNEGGNSTDNQSQTNTYQQDTQSDKTDSSNKKSDNSYVGSTVYDQSFYTYQAGSNSGNSNNSNSDNSNNKPTTYSIAVSTPTGFKSLTANKTDAKAGETVTLSYLLQAGYVFDKWDVKTSSGNAVTVINNKFSMPSESVTVSAVASKNSYVYSITINQPDNGIITAPESAIVGSQVDLSITVKSGYALDEYIVKDVQGNAVKVITKGDKNYFIMPSRNVTVSASVTKQEFSFTVNTADNNNTFAIPTSGMGGKGGTNEWNIAWGDGTTEKRTATSEEVTEGISHEYTDGVDEHMITITPADSTDAWMSVFGFSTDDTGANKIENRSCVVSIDSPLTWQMTRQTVNGDYDESTGIYKTPDSEYSFMFGMCMNLESLPENFTIPSYGNEVSEISSEFCSSMFAYCVQLKALSDNFAVPSFDSVTTVGEGFCNNMFMTCMSITSLPDSFSLPAFDNVTSVGDDFCYSIFCETGLSSLPDGFVLPSFAKLTVIGNEFCADMFNSCASLQSLPDNFSFPAFDNVTSVGDDFCSYMFYESGLESVPVFFAVSDFAKLTAVGDDFCREMFAHCDNLQSVSTGFVFPNFSVAESIGDNFCNAMFSGSTNLKSLPTDFALPAFDNIKSVGGSFYYDMFSGCSSLYELPAGFALPNFEKVTEVGSSFCSSMFLGCTDLKSLPDSFILPDFDSVKSVGSGFCGYMFSNCSSLGSLPTGFVLPGFDNVTNIDLGFFQYMFSNCSSLGSLPTGFTIPTFANASVGQNYCDYMFYGCANLILDKGFTLPYFSLDYLYSYTFGNACTNNRQSVNIADIIKPWTDAGVSQPPYEAYTFSGATGFDDYDKLSTDDNYKNWF